MKSILFTILVLISLPLPAESRIWVVSMSGSDQAPGTEAEPFRTVSRAAEVAQPGDTVLVMAGTYRERVAPARGGQPGKPIVYKGEPGKHVFIKGSEIWTPVWTDEGNGIYSARPADELFNDRSDEYVDHHNPLHIELSSTPWGREGRREADRKQAGDDRIKSADQRLVYTCGQVFMSGRWLKEVPFQDELEPGNWYYGRNDKRVYIHFGDKDPSTQQIELTTRRRLFAPKQRGLGYIIVEGFIFEHSGNQYPTDFWENDANAQKGAVGTEAGHHWVIRNNVIRHAKTVGLDVGKVDRRGKVQSVVGHIVENNYIIDNGSAGIVSYGSQDLVIRGNVVMRNNRLRFSGIKRWESAGIKAHHFRNGLIENNYIASNLETYGIWLDNQFPNARITRNVVFNNGVAGIFLEMSDYNYDTLLIDHNIVYGNQRNAVYIHDASGATFAHNLFANTPESDLFGQAVWARQVSERTRTRHHTFIKNIFINNPRQFDISYPIGRSGPHRFNHNVYGVGLRDRSFSINRESDVPKPWDPERFYEQMSEELDGVDARDTSIFTGSQARLIRKEWQSFWQRHGVSADPDSMFDPLAASVYDPNQHLLTITLSEGLSQRALNISDRIKQDFAGKPINNFPTVAGPFQSLERGQQSFTIWSGLPVLDKDELPPPAWTRH